MTIACPHLSFDPERRTVVGADGHPLHLTPKAFDLLQILIEEAPRVVRKTELHERLWPDTFVSDAALAGLVKELRRVLGDSHVRFIKTTHGVGYAFDHPCRLSSTADEGLHWLVGHGRRYLLKPGANVLGRDAGADVRLDAIQVSRHHARIVVTGEKAAIHDLGSKNGTCVGDALLDAPADLGDGDRIRIGPVELVYCRQLNDGSTATLAAGPEKNRRRPASDSTALGDFPDSSASRVVRG